MWGSCQQFAKRRLISKHSQVFLDPKTTKEAYAQLFSGIEHELEGE
jgi:hypothetical protein